VVNGGNDVIVYSMNSFILQQHLPNAQLILYPDANHGSQYQYPELSVMSRCSCRRTSIGASEFQSGHLIGSNNQDDDHAYPDRQNRSRYWRFARHRPR
jgi:hypothetical protein